MIKEILNSKNKTRNEIINLEEKVLASKQGRTLFLYAYFVKNADIERVTKALLETKGSLYIYKFALYIKNIDITLLIEKLIFQKEAKYLYLCACEIENLNKDLLLKIVKTLTSMDDEYYLNKVLYYQCIIKNNKNKELIDISKTFEYEKEYKNYINKKYPLKEWNGFSKNCNRRKDNIVPQFVVMHIENNYQKFLSKVYDEKQQVSCHFVIEENGKVKQVVSLENTAWANGTSISSESDVYYEFAEHSFFASNPQIANEASFSIVNISFDGSLTEEQKKSTIETIKKINNYVNDYYQTTIPANREHIIGYREIAPIAVTSPRNFPFEEIILELQKK